MVCVYCGQKTEVVNSRRQVKANNVWRRRQCFTCQAVFSTIEQADLTTSLAVIDKNGRIVAFSREKLLMSVLLALKDSQKQFEHAPQLCQTVISKLLKTKRASFNSRDIIVTVSSILKNFNHQAYVRYLAEYDSESVKSAK